MLGVGAGSSSIPSRTLQRSFRSGNVSFELGEVHTVVTQVRPGAVGERHRRPGHGLADHLGDVADLHVVLVPPDVERLVVDELARGLEHGQERPADVLDVHERPPRRAVAFQAHLPGRQRDGGEVVHHDVQAEPGEAPYAVALRR